MAQFKDPARLRSLIIEYLRAKEALPPERESVPPERWTAPPAEWMSQWQATCGPYFAAAVAVQRELERNNEIGGARFRGKIYYWGSSPTDGAAHFCTIADDTVATRTNLVGEPFAVGYNRSGLPVIDLDDTQP